MNKEILAPLPTIRILSKRDFVVSEIKPHAEQLTFGKLLVQLRIGAGFRSQSALAMSMGIERSTISRLEDESHKPNLSIAVALAETLNPDFSQAISLIASFASEQDSAYINNLFNFSQEDYSNRINMGINTQLSRAFSPVKKAKDYQKRRNRSSRQIAEIGGLEASTVSRFFSGENKDMKASSFISLARGLGLTRDQVVDLFYSFGNQNQYGARGARKEKAS